MADAQSFREAWGKFPTGVAVVTTIEPDGQVHGMAANGINSVSLDPLLVLVCVAHTRQSYPLIRQTGRFTINILNEGQRSIAEYFARPAEERRGDVEVPFAFTERGAAVVEGSLASMDCHIVSEHVAGDHSICIGGVDEIRTSVGQPLVFFGGSFGGLGQGFGG